MSPGKRVGHQNSGDRFGISVAMDGTDTVVGAELDDTDRKTNCGSVYINY